MIERMLPRALAAYAVQHDEREEVLREIRRMDSTRIQNVLHAPEDQRLQALIDLQRQIGPPDPEIFLTRELTDGEYLLESPRSWENFERLVQVMQDLGARFEPEHFTQRLTHGPFERSSRPELTGIEWAARHGALDKLFAPAIWQGRVDDMTRAWFGLDEQARAQIDIRAARRRVAEAGGETLPEDELARAQIRLDELHAATKAGDFSELNQRLMRRGARIDKRHLTLVDGNGISLFDDPEVWAGFAAIQGYLRGHGASFTAEDLTRPLADGASLLDRAERLGRTRHLFTPAVWEGDLQRMETTYDKLSEAAKAEIDLDLLREEIRAGAHKIEVPLDRGLTRARLMTPTAGEKGGAKILPLATSQALENLGRIQTLLAAKGEPLTLADFRKPASDGGPKLLEIAARRGYFDKVAEIARAGGERLTRDDLLLKGPGGHRVLDELAAKKQLATIFTQEQWAGRASELLEVWSELPEEARTKSGVEIKKLLTATNRAGLRDLSARDSRPAGP